MIIINDNKIIINNNNNDNNNNTIIISYKPKFNFGLKPGRAGAAKLKFAPRARILILFFSRARPVGKIEIRAPGANFNFVF